MWITYIELRIPEKLNVNDSVIVWYAVLLMACPHPPLPPPNSKNPGFQKGRFWKRYMYKIRTGSTRIADLNKYNEAYNNRCYSYSNQRSELIRSDFCTCTFSKMV